MIKRDIIHDTFNVMLEEGLGVDDSGNTIVLSEADFNKMKSCIKSLQSAMANEDLIFVFRGYSYQLSRHFSNISFPDDGRTIRLDLMFRKDKNKVRLSYALFKHSTSKLPALSFTGNPTTLINGHNTTALLLSDDPYQELKLYYQIPFLFLFEILNLKPSNELEDSIKKLKIQTNNVQWAMYLPCSNKTRTVNALKLIYARQSVDVSDDKHVEILCNYLGFNYASDQSYNNGFMLTKIHKGTGKVLTVNFYDKTLSNKDKGISGLNEEETKITDSSLRLDITAHREFIIQIINEAKRTARKLKELGKTPKYLNIKMIEVFLSSPSDRAWASNLVMAMLLLSIKQDKEGKWKKYSFSSWLKKVILVDMMKLDKLLVFNGKIDISNLTNAELKIFEKWRNNEPFSRQEKDSVSRMENKLGLSTKLPYAMLESIIMLDSVQGLPKEKRNRYVTLSCKRDNDDLTTNEAIELSTLAKESSKNIRHSRLAMAESFGIALAPTPSDHRALIGA